jgi:chemotaxis protein methyltransferase CheR
MSDATTVGRSPDDLDATLFARFAALVRGRCGIHLPPSKESLLRGRLARRMRSLGVTRFADYYALAASDPAEAAQLVNSVTTNKTSFFREPHHFDLLRAELEAHPPPAGETLKIWSAAASSGEEAYSAAMVAHQVLSPRAADVRVLATDVDTAVLARGEAAIYPEDAIRDVPPAYVRPWFRRGRGDHAGSVRVAPALRERVSFRPLNFVEDPWPLRARFRVIFCRNALIYFEGPLQRRVVERLLSYLEPGGLLFLGHSEAMLGTASRLERVGVTAFRLREERE